MDKKPFDHSFSLKDDLGVREIFFDGIHQTTVDGATAKITLTISRPDPPKPGNKSPIGQKVVVARLVMPNSTFAELFNSMNQLMTVLEQQGVVQRDGVAKQTVQ